MTERPSIGSVVIQGVTRRPTLSRCRVYCVLYGWGPGIFLYLADVCVIYVYKYGMPVIRVCDACQTRMTNSHPEYAIWSPDYGLMLGHRGRRWANNNLAAGRLFVLLGGGVHQSRHGAVKTCSQLPPANTPQSSYDGLMLAQCL